jgi:hypothetical protein
MSYYTHGETVGGESHLWGVWHNMWQRVMNLNCPNYSSYGGRGITVCNDWTDSSVFIKWAKEHGYQQGLVLDRNDVNGNYCPENCSFVTSRQSTLNRRKSPDYGISIDHNTGKFRIRLKVNYKEYFGGRADTIEEARILRDKLELKLKR